MHSRTHTEYRSGSDPRILRDALGTFATGVTVVTSLGDNGEPVGLTANSFTSVSLDPPLLLVCPARSASTTAALEDCEHFAVNVLRGDQEHISTLFATKGTDRFSQIEFDTCDHGVPIIHNALANFECRKHAVHNGGDHLILIGEITRVRFTPDHEPLLYYGGRYRGLRAD
ncbi:MAG: flavin reductase family protein [Pseudomonadota bacterium]